MMWHLLQVSHVLDLEMGSALSERVPLLAWEPQRSFLPWLPLPGLPTREVVDPPLSVHRFPLLRGYSKAPGSWVARTGPTIVKALKQQTPDAQRSPLICTIPYFAPVAERWPGPVIYWLTDRIERYEGADQQTVHRLDQRMCRAATLVCPNSQRLASYLEQQGRCAPEKLCVVPNATRASNLLKHAPGAPSPPPHDIAHLPRPFAGVIGNLAGNLDWIFLEEALARTPSFHWVFVGPTSMPIGDSVQSTARIRVQGMPNAHFCGSRPYGALAAYARCFDVAVLPYRLCEPTYSGSSTRFYEHLAACRPMIATRGFEELLHQEPLLTLVDTGKEAALKLDELRAHNFDDGLSALRWQASRNGTWQNRAEQMEQALNARLQASSPSTTLA